MARRVRIFQIFYDDATRAALDPAFEPLDNAANPRADWSEYWPIRRALGAGTFDDDEYLGFFSPRFGAKTGLRGSEVLAQIAAHDAPVYSFSPFFEQTALYRNPFEQGEVMHPGLMSVAVELCARLGITVDPRTLVSDHTTTIFANYFVAPYTLWRRWFAHAEAIFALCEENETPLARSLTGTTLHRGAATHPLKVFLMERLITLVLEQAGLRARYGIDPRRAPRALPHADQVIGHLIVLDALKGQYRATQSGLFLDQYVAIATQVKGQLAKLRAQSGR